MFPAFLRHKKRELNGFIHILKGKLTGDDRERLKGANEALNALEEEREIYLKEKKAAISRIDPEFGGYHPSSVPQDKVQRETNNRDVSGY